MKKSAKALFLFFIFPVLSFSQEREKWITMPKQQWPQIALTNHVQYKNGDQYIHSSFSYAGTGFLIDTGKDTLAATAKHALWIAKNKKTKVVELNKDLSSWVMKPKGNTRDSAILDKLINEDSSEILEGPFSTITERDWIIFSVKNISGIIYPLKPRYSVVKPGEKVYLPGCAYDDTTCVIYEGTILRKEGMDILVERNAKDFKGGASGSPVIDANGYLVGILSSSTIDGKTSKEVSVAISTEYLYNLLQQKPGLNTPKRDYGELILKTVLEKGTKAAIRQYKRLTGNKDNYYTYNLRSTNRNGLRETGQKLIELKRIKEAIIILRLNVKENSEFYADYNLLAKAYLLVGKKNKAIKTYQLSTIKYDDKQNNEAFAELAKLLVG